MGGAQPAFVERPGHGVAFSLAELVLAESTPSPDLYPRGPGHHRIRARGRSGCRVDLMAFVWVIQGHEQRYGPIRTDPSDGSAKHIDDVPGHLVAFGVLRALALVVRFGTGWFAVLVGCAQRFECVVVAPSVSRTFVG